MGGMGFFNSQPQQPQQPPQQPQKSDRALPLLPVDLTKRYDVYLRETEHDRLYENVRFMSLRTFDQITDYSPFAFGCYLEIEALDDTRCLIPASHITAVCEHGVKMASKLLRRRRGVRED